MKKILFLIFISIFSLNTIYATDSCKKIVPQYAEFTGEITFGVNIRSYPCVYNSTIIKGAKTGEQYKVISKVDGWYKVKLDNGNYAWIRDKAIKRIGDLPKEDKNTEIIKKEYILNSDDYKLINKINSRISDIVNSKGYKYKEIFISRLQKLLINKKRSERFIKVINKIIENTKKINLKENALNLYKRFNIDIKKVKDYWLTLHNNERKKLGLAPLSYDERLNNTAYEWAMISKDKGNLDHRRNLSDSTYDYKKIENWFQERGVKCKIKARTTSSESIGKFSYRCSDSDCSDELYKSTKEIFDLYMAEKGTSYTPHYRAIVHKYITKLGLGFSISGPDNEGFYNYYMVTHYCTEFEN